MSVKKCLKYTKLDWCSPERKPAALIIHSSTHTSNYIWKILEVLSLTYTSFQRETMPDLLSPVTSLRTGMVNGHSPSPHDQHLHWSPATSAGRSKGSAKGATGGETGWDVWVAI